MWIRRQPKRLKTFLPNYPVAFFLLSRIIFRMIDDKKKAFAKEFRFSHNHMEHGGI